MAWKYVLFDLDGTLTDSGPGIIKSVRYALGALGIEEDSEERLRSFIGPPLYHSFMQYYGFDRAKADIAVDKYREYFAVRGMYENSLYPGIGELLAALCREGRTLAVATSKPTVFARQIAAYFGVDRHFAFIGGSELDGSRMDKADVIAYVLHELGSPAPGDTVMVGDREHDVLGAKANGLRSVGVLYGYGKRREMEEAGADAIVSTVGELAEALRRM